MILFMICLFLFTTIWVYYIFFTLLNLFLKGVIIFIIWLTYFIILNFPLGQLYCRFTQPKRFCQQIYFLRIDNDEDDVVTLPVNNNNNNNNNNNAIRIFEIRSILQSVSYILAASYMTGFTHFLKRMPTFLAEVVTGTPCSIVKTCVEASRENVSKSKVE